MGSSWKKWVPQWWHEIRKGRYTIEEGEKEHLTFQHIFTVTYEWACRIRIQRSQTYLMWIHLPVLLKWHLWVHKSSVINTGRRAKDLRNTSPQGVGLCSSFWAAVTEYHRPSASQWQTYIPHRPGGWKSKICVPVWLCEVTGFSLYRRWRKGKGFLWDLLQ